MTLPNIITLLRLVLVPLVIYLILNESYASAFWMFVLAGISDGVDGYIAKTFDQESVLGGYLDPLADKALLVSIFITLGLMGHLPDWLVLLVVSRDVLIIGGVVLAWMMANPVIMRPLLVSKANTVAQIVLAAVALSDLAFDVIPADMGLALIIVVAGLTIASAGAYLVTWMQHMASDQPQE